MRTTLLAIATLAATLVRAARGQNATISIRTVTREGGEPLSFTSVAAPQHDLQRLTNESGTLVLPNLSPGAVTLRFRRIGFAPKDTVVDLTAGDTARVVVAMVRLAIQLPTVVVEGTCTDRTPFEEKQPILAQLFDQVRQNAERLVLLAKERPFKIEASHEEGPRRRGAVPPTLAFTRGPLPDRPYVPGRIYWPMGKTYGVQLPELADIADTSFTNNHCFWYAGQTQFGTDSVVRVDFEPVPWLAIDVNHNYFRNVPTFDTVLLGTGLLDKYLFTGLSAGLRVELPRGIAVYGSMGQNQRSGDARGSLNQMYGIAFRNVLGSRMRADLRHSVFHGPFGDGWYQSLSVSREVGERLRFEVQGGDQELRSLLSGHNRGFWMNSTVDRSIGTHYVMGAGLSMFRGNVQHYDQTYLSFGYRF